MSGKDTVTLLQKLSMDVSGKSQSRKVTLHGSIIFHIGFIHSVQDGNIVCTEPAMTVEGQPYIHLIKIDLSPSLMLHPDGLRFTMLKAPDFLAKGDIQRRPV